MCVCFVFGWYGGVLLCLVMCDVGVDLLCHVCFAFGVMSCVCVMSDALCVIVWHRVCCVCCRPVCVCCDVLVVVVVSLFVSCVEYVMRVLGSRDLWFVCFVVCLCVCVV